MTRATIGLVLLLLVPRPAPAQAPTLPVSSGYDLDRDIAEYQDIMKKIREGWIYIPAPITGAFGAFISREAEAGLFSHMILLGTMHPDSVAFKHRQLREMTRMVGNEIARILPQLEYQLDIRDGAPFAEPPLAPDLSRGVITGTWAVACVVSGDAGTFTLTFPGNGAVSGSYTSDSGGFSVSGNVDPAGNAQGSGSHPDGAFTWTAKIVNEDGVPAMTSGGVYFSPHDRSITCSTGTLTQTGSSALSR